MRQRSKSLYVDSHSENLRNFYNEEQPSEEDSDDEENDLNSNNYIDASEQNNSLGEHVSAETDLMLVGKIWEHLPKNDSEPYDARIDLLDWEQIAIEGYSSRELQKRFSQILNNVRTHRILKEVLEDVEKYLLNSLSLPKKPASAFVLFMQQNKNQIKEMSKEHKGNSFLKCASIAFQSLSEEKLQKLKQKSEIIRKEYKDVVLKFNLDHKTKEKGQRQRQSPFNLFWHHKNQFESGANYAQARKMYAELSPDDKLKWILRFLGASRNNKLSLVQYNNAKANLNKEEMNIIHDFEGRPRKTSAYNAFIKEYCRKKKNRSNLPWKDFFKAGAEKWQNLSPEKKEYYQNLSKQMKLSYDGAFKDYIESLPEERRSALIEKSEGKRKAEQNQSDEIKRKKKKMSNQNTEISNNLSRQDISKEMPQSSPEKTVKKKSKKKKDHSMDENDNKEENHSPKKKKNKSNETNNLTRVQSLSPEKTKFQEPQVKSESSQIRLKQKPTAFPPIEKPPSSVYKYFVKEIYQGPRGNAKEEYKKLNARERKNVSSKYARVKKKYLKSFEDYLKTLSAEEIKSFAEQYNSTELDTSDLSESY